MAREYLGRAAKFPLQPDTDNQIDKVEGFDCINQSIRDILDTPVGEMLHLYYRFTEHIYTNSHLSRTMIF